MLTAALVLLLLASLPGLAVGIACNLGPTGDPRCDRYPSKHGDDTPTVPIPTAFGGAS